jgi:hypothetical protein
MPDRYLAQQSFPAARQRPAHRHCHPGVGVDQHRQARRVPVILGRGGDLPIPGGGPPVPSTMNFAELSGVGRSTVCQAIEHRKMSVRPPGMTSGERPQLPRTGCHGS